MINALKNVVLCISVLIIAPLVLGQTTQRSDRDDEFRITIKREVETDDCTRGSLLVNGETVSKTLEKPWKDNIEYVSSIPPGEYPGNVRYDHADFWRIELVGVKDRTFVQIHIGNTVQPTPKKPKPDSVGCILVGTGYDVSGCVITGSADAYRSLKKLFYGTETPNSSPDKKIVVTVLAAPSPFEGKWTSNAFKGKDGKEVAAGRWQIEVKDGKVKWTENRDGKQRSLDSQIEAKAKELKLQRANSDGAILDFLGYVPARREWILSHSPGPSKLALKRDGESLKGTWSALSLVMRDEHFKEGTKDKVRQVPDHLDYPTVEVTFKKDG